MVGGDIDLQNAVIIGDSPALNLNKAHIAGSISICGNSVDSQNIEYGRISASQCVIGSDLTIKSMRFKSLPPKAPPSFNAAVASMLEPHRYPPSLPDPVVDLRFANIAGCLKISGTELNGGSLNLSGIHIGRNLTMYMQSRNYDVDLSSGDVNNIEDDIESWPREIKLSDLVYNHINPPDGRTYWLKLQNEWNFDSQPYEQLALVLKENGDDDDAIAVNVKKNADEGTFIEDATTLPERLTSPRDTWICYIGGLIGYGYYS